MRLSDFNYYLPKNLIATKQIKPRDRSRLLVLYKESGEIKHKHFFDIVDYLHAGDVLVLNNSKVFSARLLGKKKETGGKAEVFLHQKISQNLWQCLLGGRGIKEKLEIKFEKKLTCRVKKNNNDGTWDVEFNIGGDRFMKLVEKIGHVPLPPYIPRENIKSDQENYQTVYADDKRLGSVAAPTAGLHFTKKLLNDIKKKGVEIEYVTLHVGLGTFAPVKVDNVENHKMHAEWVEVKKEVIKNIIEAKKSGGKIVAVGTTSARTLEAVFQKKINIKKDYNSWVDIFIYPGYKFKVVDALITNFHLPKSTLLMLVSALAGKKYIDRAYQKAIKKKYKFYSYGDAMMITSS
ncbi:MAG: tRNA preQ1(34) S-adenosylmethionine ribosyltransferase-isomerase QueA [bacterium]